MIEIKIKLTEKQFARLAKDAREDGITPESRAKKEIAFYIENLEDQDMKGCKGGWYRGHSPREPNDGSRAICNNCGMGLVKHENAWRTTWTLDKTKKALHLPENRHLLMQVKK